MSYSSETEVPSLSENNFLQSFLSLEQRLTRLENQLSEIHTLLLSQKIEKEWYTSTELAEAMHVSQYTVQERWCNQGRIECEKATDTGKWRIPGHEYRRLLAGGELSSRQR